MITNRDELINAMANNTSRLVIDKASISSQAAGTFVSLWRATGQPGQGAIPTTAAVCNNSLVGCFGFAQQTDPEKMSYLVSLEFASSNASMTLEIHDRLMHMGGLVGNVATLQTVNLNLAGSLATDNLTNRIGDDNFSDVQWWLEWYTATGSTAATATVNVTYTDDTTGNLTGASLSATRPASFILPLNSLIPAAKSGYFIKGINNVTLSVSTGTAGNFGVTVTRPRCSFGSPIANYKMSADWATLPMARVPNSSCLFPLVLTSTTSSGTLRGGGRIVAG